MKFPIRVLMVCHTSAMTGPNRTALSLLKGIDKNKCAIDVASPAGGDFSNALRELGINHIPLDFAPKRDIFTVLGLIRILKRGRYNIVHGHLARVGPIIMSAGKLSGVPAIILTAHMNNPEHGWLEGRPVRLFFHRLFHIVSNNCIDKVIAVSESTKANYITRQGIKPEKVATIYNSTELWKDKPFLGDLDKAFMRRSFGAEKGGLVIATVNRLVKVKGIQDFILAAKDVVNYDAGAAFIIVGEGEYRQELEMLVISNNLQKKVKFLGFRKDIDDIMQAIDILVQPAHAKPPESFGLALIEAMSARKPVIASEIGPFREIVEDGKSGLFFPPDNPKILADKIIFLIKDREIMRNMGEGGFKIVKEKFNHEKIAQKTENLYINVLSRKI